MNSFWQGFEKRAAPRWIKLLRKGELTIDQAANVAKKLRLNPRSVTGLPTAKGSEAVSTLVTHPDAGLAMQKAFDPESPLYSKGLLDQRINVAKKLEDHPSMAKYLGKHRRDVPVVYQEFVKGPTLSEKFKAQTIKGSKSKNMPILKDLNRTAKKRGVGTLHDLNLSNVVIGETGPKVVDFLPSNRAPGSMWGDYGKLMNEGKVEEAGKLKEVINSKHEATKGDWVGALQRAFGRKKS